MSKDAFLFEKGMVIEGSRRNRSVDITVSEEDGMVYVETAAFLCDGGALSPWDARRLGDLLIEASKVGMAVKASKAFAGKVSDE